VSTESTHPDSNHPAGHPESHHPKGASFVDPMGTSEIEEDSARHGGHDQGPSEAMLEGAHELGASDPDPTAFADGPIAPTMEGPLALSASLEQLDNTKVTLVNADQWMEEIKVRMDKLRQDVDELNARLDRLRRPVVK